MLAGKKIIVAVCGSIAAYKAVFLVRLLIKEQAEVKVIMTKMATAFLSPLTLATISKNPVNCDLFEQSTGSWNSHIELSQWADLMVVAPLSAHTLAKMTTGLCDNLLLATYLSLTCPMIVAPAMDLDMYAHPTTCHNLQKLKGFGHYVVAAKEGELASGLTGKGRMAEPEELIEKIKRLLAKQSSNQQNHVLEGKKVLITSGSTREAIDPVRFISNRSSGKMGYALANAFHEKGANVQLITGPTPHYEHHWEVVHVESAHEMYVSTKKNYASCDIAVFAAAVTDFRIDHYQKEKIKSNSKEKVLNLVKNPDIAYEMGKQKNGKINIGFALETENELSHAREKLKFKNFDLIVLNSLNENGSGFEVDTNKVTFIDAQNKEVNFKLKSKKEVAVDIVNYIVQNLV